MDSINNTGKYLRGLRWFVLIGGISATLAGWFFSGEFTPMILLPTTLGIVGYVILYVLWAVGFLMHRSEQRARNIEKRVAYAQLSSKKVVWNDEVVRMRN
ncbi:MAG: hypothetical protein AAF984_02205 [Verrucomicrobiota bacterium]